MRDLLERAAEQYVIAENKWSKTLAGVIRELIDEVLQRDREKEFWKREFHKQEERATKAEKKLSSHFLHRNSVSAVDYCPECDTHCSDCDISEITLDMNSGE